MLFLDSREKACDIQSKINLHNNNAGRLVCSIFNVNQLINIILISFLFVKAYLENMKIRCKCHGLSGSCQLRTCWKSAPEFRIVGKELLRLFRTAILVDQTNLIGNSRLIINSNQPGQRKAKRNNSSYDSKKLYIEQKLNEEAQEKSLFYYQRSPSFCEADPSSDIPGKQNKTKMNNME